MTTECILNHPDLSARIFYPWPSRFAEPFFIEGEAGRLGCHYRREHPDAPTVVHFHGNGETVADYVDDFAPAMVRLRANLLLAEYRGYGMSDGEPGLAAILEDIPAIVLAAGVEPSRLIFFGRSLGSLCAVHAACLYPKAAGLVVESGIADPLELILQRVEPRRMECSTEQLSAEVGRIFDQKAKLAAFLGRTLIMHTQNDDTVPVAHAQLLHQWAPEPKELLIFDRGDHNNIMEVNRDRYFAALERMIRQFSE